MFIKTLVLIILIFVLQSCKVGPNYQIPTTAVYNNPAAHTLLNNTDLVFSNQATPDRWWELYHDPVLNDLIEEALCANTDLRIADANIQRANARTGEAKALLYPSTQLFATYGNFHLSAETVVFEPPIPTLPFVNYLIQGGSVILPIDFFGKLRRGIEAAEDNQQAVEAAHDLVRITVIAETASAYADMCAAGYQLKIAEHLLSLQKQTTKLTQRLQQGGKIIMLDVTQSKTELEQIRASIPNLKISKQNARYRLTALTGHVPAESEELIPDCQCLPVLQAIIPVCNGTTLLRRRPDVREAERELAAATAKIGVKVAELYPDISLAGLAGTLGYIQDVGKLSTFYSAIAPLITWAFPNQSIVRAHIAQAEASEQASFAKFDAVVLKALKEIETNMATYVHDLERFYDLKSAHAHSKKAFMQAKLLYSNGRKGFLTVLEAEKAHTNVSMSLAIAESKLVTDQMNLFLSLGGWDCD